MIHMMFKRKAAPRPFHPDLLTGEVPCARFDGTVLVGQNYSSLAAGEEELVAECATLGRSIEFLAGSPDAPVRIYRIDHGA